MSKAGPSSTTTQTSSLPPWAQQAQQNLLNTAGNLTSGFTGSNPNYSVMGLTPDQLTANDLARQTAQGVFSQKSIPAYDVFGMGNQWNTGSPVSTPQATAGQATAAQANAAQLDPNAISQFMNPYINAALNPALERLRQQNGEVQAKIGADAAASHMFGGSREAVSRMLADRNYRDAVGTTTGNMLNAGWNAASGLASGNSDRQQQTNLTNAQMQTGVSQSNADRATDVSKMNASQALQAALQQQNLSFNGAQNDANRFLQGLQLQGNLDTQGLQNKMNIINMLNGFGTQQQTVGQNALNAPFTALQRLAAVTPQQYATNSTSQQSSSQPMNPLQMLMGIGMLASGNPMGLAPLAGGLSSAFGGLGSAPSGVDTVNFGV